MTRIIKVDNFYNVQDKFLWFWVDKTAQDKYGNDLPCTLTGFNTLREALDECQSVDVYLHNSVFDRNQIKLDTLKDMYRKQVCRQARVKASEISSITEEMDVIYIGDLLRGYSTKILSKILRQTEELINERINTPATTKRVV